MKFKTTLILFVSFIVLLAFILLFDFSNEDKEDTEDKLIDLSSDDIEKIIFKKEDEAMTFEKDSEGNWLIIQPLEANADKYEVERIADDFSDLKVERVVEEEPTEIEKYGIPKKEIFLFYKEKEESVHILIGDENPLDNTFFAKKEDEMRVVLIPSHLKSLLEKNVFDFRQKDIFKFETDEVKNIRLQTKEVKWEASKKDEEWFLNKPFESLAEKSQIDGILNSLSGLKAKEFISEDKKREELKEYRLDRPENKIILSLPIKNQEVIFSIQKSEDKVYATTSLSPKIIEVEDSILSDIEKKADDLREKEIADFFSWEANKLRIKIDQKSNKEPNASTEQDIEIDLIIVKDEENNWHFESPTTGEADKNKIETFIRKIESLEANAFIDPPLNLKDYSLDDPQAEVKIWVKEDDEKVKEVTILIGSEDEETKEVVVKNARFDYLFRVDSEFLQEFPKGLADWKKEAEEK